MSSHGDIIKVARHYCMPIGRIIPAGTLLCRLSLVTLAVVRRTSVTVGTFVGLANVAYCSQRTYAVTFRESA